MPHWQGENSPNSIQEVYDYVDRKLKALKTRLATKVEKQFYGNVDPIQFLIQVEETIKSKHRVKCIQSLVPRISSLQDLELFFRTCTEMRQTGGVRNAVCTKNLQAFVDALKRALLMLIELLDEIKDVYAIVQTFCRNYQSLEGEFDLKWVREINLELKNSIANIENMVENSETSLNTKLFSSAKFSLEVAEACDTRRYPILRLVPDVVHKFYHVLYLLGRWRVNDQLYLEDIQFKIIETKRFQRLKQEEYNSLELEHSNILTITVERRVRVKIREVRERLRQMEQDVQKLTKMKRIMESERHDAEKVILERKHVLNFNKNAIGNSLPPEIDNVLGLKKDIRILVKKHKSLTKSLKINERDVKFKLIEKKNLENTFEDMRTLVTRSNQLASERTKLLKKISIITETIGELESIFYRKTDRSKLILAYNDVKNILAI
ncbi:uncharacterized protein LOC117115824 [Anneissia japonica]|uniref:uncharacterized protein LOC117115824 n=1 Tax=Anneissia japonica TaxID=1529436 RepID=UPI001425563C|nr:uncharacterized protein LOC117115824 [Anneissia japonica]